MRICLGTVQQGMDYGVYGGKKPDEDESIRLYERAVELGVDTFDTATQYGDAERLLGKFLEKNPGANIKLISKLLPSALDSIPAEDYVKTVRQEFEESLKKLGTAKIHGYLLHNPNHVFDVRILEAMYAIKESGHAEYVGASVYTPKQALAAAASPFVDYIQIPYNILDRRLDVADFFTLAKKNGKTVFARSTFLQGLLLMELDAVAEKLPIALPYIRRFRELAGGIPLHRACLEWSKSNPAIDYLVLGVTGMQDLEQNVIAFNSAAEIEDFIDRAKYSFYDVPETVVRPDLW